MCDPRGTGVTRRQAVGALGAAALFGRSAFAADRRTPSYREAADGAQQWLVRHAIPTADGVTWAADPLDPKSVQRSLYSGAAGVVLFLVEHARVTGQQGSLDLAVGGARELAAAVARAGATRQRGSATEFDGEGAGLYTGIAGVAVVLDRVHRLTGETGFRTASSSVVRFLGEAITPDGPGGAWNGSTDIISGTAGIGLTLLWAARTLGDERAVELATRAGRSVLAVGTPANSGLTWRISPQTPRRYPNFSHGAGGVGTFLTSLYAVTKDEAFLDGARKAATYLQSVATPTANGGKMVFHSEGNEQLFYLSWCHGPSGTARLFHRLGEVTKERAYTAFADQLNVATRDMKVPDRSPGFWNNVSQCCGNCGVVEHFVAMYDRTGDMRHLDYARLVADDVTARATPDGDGFKWIQAEHRVRPELLVAQTGLMQGAAGVGLALLHMDGAVNRRAPFVGLPDSPYFV
jgi:lantibiotic modifying enzyme